MRQATAAHAPSPVDDRKDTVSHADRTSASDPPPEFFPNVVKQLRAHWVDAEATRRGVDPVTVTRALIIGNNADAEVRIGAAVRAAVYLGDDRIVSLDEAAAIISNPEEVRGIVHDVSPDSPYMFFDLHLGQLQFDLQPRREWAKRHLAVAEQFQFVVGPLVERGGFGAACENLFACAELATMALMEAGNQPLFGHRARSEWLAANGAAFGLSEVESEVLGVLLTARNVYRYGDPSSVISAVELMDRLAHVDKLIVAARSVVGGSAD